MQEEGPVHTLMPLIWGQRQEHPWLGRDCLKEEEEEEEGQWRVRKRSSGRGLTGARPRSTVQGRCGVTSYSPMGPGWGQPRPEQPRPGLPCTPLQTLGAGSLHHPCAPHPASTGLPKSRTPCSIASEWEEKTQTHLEQQINISIKQNSQTSQTLER